MSEWFDEEHLLLDETHLENLDPESFAYEQEEIEMDSTYGIKTKGVRLPGGMIITGLPEKKPSPKIIKLPTSEDAQIPMRLELPCKRPAIVLNVVKEPSKPISCGLNVFSLNATLGMFCRKIVLT